MSTVKRGYLALYNSASAIAWLVVLGRVVAVNYFRGPMLVPMVVEEWCRYTQSVAVLEVVHALTGVVPAPFFTTAVQVASRQILVWGICYLFPFLNSSPWYSSMLLAWSTTEVIRYSFFTCKQVGLSPPGWLLWLRYSSFTVLYPIGISSEVVMITKAILGPAASFAPWYPYVLGAILAAYVPCSIMLYSHMLKQRRKQLRPNSETKSK